MEALYDRPTRVGMQLRTPPTAVVLDLLAEDLVRARRARHLSLLLELGGLAFGPVRTAGEVPDAVHDAWLAADPAADERGDAGLLRWLAPVVARLGQVRLDAVFVQRRAGGFTRLRMAPSRPGPVPPAPAVQTLLTAQATSIDWKQQLHDACRAEVARPAPPGPVAVELRLTVSRRRDWTALWRPALQALGPVLGVPDPERPYIADVARVVSLGLHRRLDDHVGPRVGVELWWYPEDVVQVSPNRKVDISMRLVQG